MVGWLNEILRILFNNVADGLCGRYKIEETGRKEDVRPDHNHYISPVLFGKGFSIKRTFILINAKLRSLKSFYNLDSL